MINVVLPLGDAPPGGGSAALALRLLMALPVAAAVPLWVFQTLRAD